MTQPSSRAPSFIYRCIFICAILHVSLFSIFISLICGESCRSDTVHSRHCSHTPMMPPWQIKYTIPVSSYRITRKICSTFVCQQPQTPLSHGIFTCYCHKYIFVHSLQCKVIECWIPFLLSACSWFWICLCVLFLLSAECLPHGIHFCAHIGVPFFTIAHLILDQVFTVANKPRYFWSALLCNYPYCLTFFIEHNA